jgi:hypothetical protein
MNVRKIINIAMEQNNIEDYVEDGFFQLYIAEKEDFEPNISVDKVIEDLQEQVYDELDDEDYLENLKDKEKEELEESLNLVLKRFLKKYNLKPNNYLVKNKKCFLVRSDGKVYNETNCEDEEY